MYYYLDLAATPSTKLIETDKPISPLPKYYKEISESEAKRYMVKDGVALEAFKKNAKQFNEALEMGKKQKAFEVVYTDLSGREHHRYWSGARYEERPSQMAKERSGFSGIYRAQFKDARDMTRKEMIEACVDDQIKRGIVKAENREMQINSRLKGTFNMSYSECVRWYKEVFGKAPIKDGVDYGMGAKVGNIMVFSRSGAIEAYKKFVKHFAKTKSMEAAKVVSDVEEDMLKLGFSREDLEKFEIQAYKDSTKDSLSNADIKRIGELVKSIIIDKYTDLSKAKQSGHFMKHIKDVIAKQLFNAGIDYNDAMIQDIINYIFK